MKSFKKLGKAKKEVWLLRKKKADFGKKLIKKAW